MFDNPLTDNIVGFIQLKSLSHGKGRMNKNSFVGTEAGIAIVIHLLFFIGLYYEWGPCRWKKTWPDFLLVPVILFTTVLIFYQKQYEKLEVKRGFHLAPDMSAVKTDHMQITVNWEVFIFN